MEILIRCVKFLSFTLLFNLTSLVIGIKLPKTKFRIKRQDGYMYKKPMVAFELPPRSSFYSTTASTQAVPPEVTTTLNKYEYYAPGDHSQDISTNTDSTNMGYSSPGDTAASVITEPTSGGVNTGYNYDTQRSIGTGFGRSVCNSNFSCESTSPVKILPSMSTKVPEYLPPKDEKEPVNTQATVNISPKVNLLDVVPTLPAPVAENKYLPPASTDELVSRPPSIISARSSSSSSEATLSPVGYLPPISIGSQSVLVVSTPASTYLPPIF